MVDAFTRECLAIEVDQGLRGDHVVSVMERLTFLRVDNGPRARGQVLNDLFG